MRLRIVSDIHIDAHGGEPVPEAAADLTLFAGDWANGDYLLRQGFSGLNCNGPLIGVLGNHEWYGLDLDRDAARLRKLAGQAGLRLLDCEACEIGGWTILGCSLWTDFALSGAPRDAMQLAEDVLSDFQGIRFAGRALRAADLVALHRAHRDWLDRQLARGDPARTIVLTHFGPHPQSVHQLYRQEPNAALNPYFVSDTGLIEKHQPALWIHGHTHQCLDYRVGRSRVICHPRGYPGERQRPGFEPSRVWDLSAAMPGVSHGA